MSPRITTDSERRAAMEARKQGRHLRGVWSMTAVLIATGVSACNGSFGGMAANTSGAGGSGSSPATNTGAGGSGMIQTGSGGSGPVTQDVGIVTTGTAPAETAGVLVMRRLTYREYD